MTRTPTTAIALLTATALCSIAGEAAAQGFGIDFCPTAREVILDTSFTQVAGCNTPPINVAGGMFFFRNVTIPAGTTVRGVGPNPMVWIVSGTFRVDGTLAVNGADGDRVDTLNSANFPTAGGIGVCGGGSGGRGSPDSTDRSFVGQSGFGSFQTPALGGRGGLLSCPTTNGPGSGGGGGVFGTAGDPWYRTSDGLTVLQQFGVGGAGGNNGSLQGGLPGLPVFLDGTRANDFHGVGIDFFGARLVQGELSFLRSGSGGGGGGDRSLACSNNDPSFISDNKGGGGGGAGGILVVFAIGDVVVGPQGRISADGGMGGGGEPAGANQWGGGGAGGAGGIVILATQNRIVLHAHGETYANADYSFSVTADGGIGGQGPFGGTAINGKYPPPPASAFRGSPTGGFGGMGVVQFIAPFGRNTDGTNTLLDDHVDVIGAGGTPMTGIEKQRYLGWEGWPTAHGTWVDDSGNVTATAGGQGDIRPAPKLLPLF